MTLILAIAGGLLLYVVFNKFLKRHLQKAKQHRDTIETGTLIAAVIAVVLAAASLIHTQNVVSALESRITALERVVLNPPRVNP